MSEAPTQTALWRVIIPICLQQRRALTSGQLEWAKASLQEPAGVIERGQRERWVGGGEGKQFNYEAAAQGHCGSKGSDDGGWRRVCGKHSPIPPSAPSLDLPLHWSTLFTDQVKASKWLLYYVLYVYVRTIMAKV